MVHWIFSDTFISVSLTLCRMVLASIVRVSHHVTLLSSPPYEGTFYDSPEEPLGFKLPSGKYKTDTQSLFHTNCHLSILQMLMKHL